MTLADSVAAVRRLVRSRAAWAAVALVALRLWLGGGLALHVEAHTERDDAMFLAIAGEIGRGQWLGAFNCLTLSKMPLYPAWLAAVLWSGAPLVATQQALHVLACAAFALAVAPALPSAAWRLSLLAGLLFLPAAAAAPLVTRVSREGIYASLTLLTLAAAAAAALRLARGQGAAAGGAAAGLALAALWLTREEGVWILPSLALLAGAPWLLLPRPRPAAWGGALLAGALAFAVAWAAVASTNGERYDRFTVRDDALATGYGALSRVEPERRRPYRPVPAEVRRRIYAVSASFAELAPGLEGPVLEFWSRSSCQVVGVCDDVGGGWLLWALRDAAQAAGHCASGPEEARYWGRVAAEVDQACGDGRLACGPARASLAEPVRLAEAPAILGAAGRAIGQLAWPRGLPAWIGPSPVTGNEPGPFALLAGQPLAGPEPGARLRLLDALGALWGPLQAAAAALGLVAFLAVAIRAARARVRPPPAWWLAGAMAAGVLARAAVVAYVEVTSFPAVEPLYLAPAYPLVVAFAALALAAAAAARRA